MPQANAFVLATVDGQGRPSTRALLLKSFGASGFEFFSNYESRKGKELSSNRWASMCFVWIEMHRQVRVEGFVEKGSEERAEEYFASRPHGAQVSAGASPQSKVVADRATLESIRFEYEATHRESIPRPKHWGAYLVVPHEMEFWQGRPDRFHDRIRYRRSGGEWITERLAP